jgi:hypothetical protein
MNTIKMIDWSEQRKQIEKSWSALNGDLQSIRKKQGLVAAFAALSDQQIKAGFIQDNLDGVIRYRLSDPLDPNRFYSGQFTPQRALRFGGFGRREPPVGATKSHNGCFLCQDNIYWQHDGRQLGMDLRLGEIDYIALTNPFPLMPMHMVIAAADHTPQACGLLATTGLEKSLGSILDHILSLATELPGFVIFYNGVDAGASIPHHLHFQTFARPTGYGLFPLEKSAMQHDDFPCWIDDYPLPTRVWHGSLQEIREEAQHWIYAWVQRNEEQAHHLSANLIATPDEKAKGRFFLYFVPRTRKTISIDQPLSINIGGLEVLGELVFTLEEDKNRLETGLLDFHSIEHILASVGSVTAASFPNP